MKRYRQDEFVPVDSINNPLIGKDCSISFVLSGTMGIYVKKEVVYLIIMLQYISNKDI